MLRKIEPILLIVIFILAFALRFWNLDKIPDGYREDATSLGYNAYSILKTGQDEHGVAYPQNFKAFGEYKLPGYIYASVIPISLFGLNAFSIRFVAALSGLLIILFSYLLTRQLSKKLELLPNFKDTARFLPLTIAFLLAVNPWLIHFSRSAFEVTLANLFVVSGTFFFVKGTYSKNLYTYFLSILLFVASIYTYNIARLFVPLLLVSLIVIFRKDIFSLSKKYIASVVLFGFLLTIPFLLGAVSKGGADSTLGTLIFTSAKVQAPLQEFRSYFVEDYPLLAKLFFNYYFMTGWVFLNNIFLHLSNTFFFITGPEPGSTSFGNIGQWYLFELPLVIIGAIFLGLRKSKANFVIFSWIVGLILVSSITREPPQATRTFFLIYPISFLSSLGFIISINCIRRLTNKKFSYLLFFLIFSVVLYSFVYFTATYFVKFPVSNASDWRYADREVARFIEKNSRKYERFIIDKNAGINYSILLVEWNYPPEKFIKEAVWEPEDTEGFTYPSKFANVEIRDIDWENDLAIPNTILITKPGTPKVETGILQTIFYPERPVVVTEGQRIIRYPYRDPALVIIETIAK